MDFGQLSRVAALELFRDFLEQQEKTNTKKQLLVFSSSPRRMFSVSEPFGVLVTDPLPVFISWMAGLSQ